MRRLSKLAKVGILLLVFLGGILLINAMLVRLTEDTADWKEFYGFKDDTIDMVFFGSSNAYCTFVPMIYNESLKIDSYNMSSSSATIEQIYYSMVEVFKTQSPKVVVLELYSIREYDISEYNYHAVHKAFDTMNLSKNKIDAIIYNVPDDKKQAFLLPFTVYHTRWKTPSELKNNIYGYKVYNKYYGASPFTIVQDDAPLENISISNHYVITEKKAYLPQNRMEILDKIVALCEENGAKLLFVKSPYLVEDEDRPGKINIFEYINGLYDYAGNNNIDIIILNDFLAYMGLELRDFFNKGHLNIVGAGKASEYFSQYLKENYGYLFEDCEFDFGVENSEKLKEYYREIEVFKEKNNYNQ